MFCSHSTKKQRRYSYYVCGQAQQRGAASCPGQSIPVACIEGALLAGLGELAEAGAHLVHLRFSGHHHHLCRLEARIGAQTLYELQSVHARHVPIHQYERHFFAQQAQRFGAIGGGARVARRRDDGYYPEGLVAGLDGIRKGEIITCVEDLPTHSRARISARAFASFKSLAGGWCCA